MSNTRRLTTLPKIGLERAELFVESLPDFISFYEAVNAVVKIKFVEASFIKNELQPF
jgi:hypothetical protein